MAAPAASSPTRKPGGFEAPWLQGAEAGTASHMMSAFNEEVEKPHSQPPHPPKHRRCRRRHRRHKRQLCHPPFNDDMMEAIDGGLQRCCLIRPLPASVEHIRNTPRRSPGCCDPYGTSIFLLCSQLRGRVNQRGRGRAGGRRQSPPVREGGADASQLGGGGRQHLRVHVYCLCRNVDELVT